MKEHDGNDDKARMRADEAKRLVEMGVRLTNEQDEKSWEEAASCYKKAIELSDDPTANFALGLAYFGGQGVERSYEEALKLFLHAANLGDAGAMYWVSICYGKGMGVEKSYDEAKKWLRKAALGGYSLAEKMYGEAEIYDCSDEESVDEGIKFICDAASHGDEGAQKLVAKLDDDKAIVDRSEDGKAAGRRPLTDRQVAMLADGMFGIAYLYKANECLGATDEYVASWLSRAADDGNANAMYALSTILMGKESSLYSPDTALSLMEESARRGCPAAEYCLGRFYFEGLLVERDDEKAYEWLSNAAADGVNDAKEYLDRYFN